MGVRARARGRRPVQQEVGGSTRGDPSAIAHLQVVLEAAQDRALLRPLVLLLGRHGERRACGGDSTRGRREEGRLFLLLARAALRVVKRFSEL